MYPLNNSCVGMAFLMCLILATTSSSAEENLATISVEGTADVRVVPDEGVLVFSIEFREKDMDQAVAKTDEHLRQVVEFLVQSQIESRDIRTEVLRIRPLFDERKQAQSRVPDDDPALKLLKPVGYMARRQLSVSIKELERYEDIYRGLLKRGVSEISGIQFISSELRKHKDQARKKAIIAAREKAEALATELGATLAAVQTINEITPRLGYGSNFRNDLSDAGGSGTGTAIGLIEIRATVSVVFRLGNTDM